MATHLMQPCDALVAMATPQPCDAVAGIVTHHVTGNHQIMLNMGRSSVYSVCVSAERFGERLQYKLPCTYYMNRL